MVSRLVRRLSFALLSAALPAALGAQQDSASQSDSTRAHRLNPIVVTASRDPLPANKLGVTASVLTAQDLAKEPARSAGDALSRLPGVFMDATVGPDGPSNIRIRGGDESFTKVLMDGVEVNFSGGPFEFEGITASNVGRIELVRGPQSALHGSSAMTGVVQLFTAEGTPGLPRWTVTMEGGATAVNGNHARGTFDVAGGSDVVRYSASLGAMYDQGIYAVPNRLLTRDASARVDVTPGGPFTLSTALRFYDMSSHLPVRDPGATVVPLDSNQRTAHEFQTVAVTARYQPSAAWTHELAFTVLHDGFEYADLQDSITADSTTLAAQGIFTANSDIFLHQDLVRPTLTYTATRRFGGPAGGAAVTLGGAIEREIANDSVGDLLSGATTPNHRNHGSLFSEINATLSPSLNVLAGGRLESYDGLGATLVPRVSAAFSVVPDRVTLRAALGRGFKAANLEQQFLNVPPFVANPDLKPESSWSWELGGSVASGTGFSGSATFFHQAFYDLIRIVPLDTTGDVTIKNLGQSNANGVELTAGYTAPSGVNASANVSWVRTSVVDNVGLDPAQYPMDSVLPFRPAVTAGAMLDVPLGRFRAVARGTIVGSEVVLTARFQGTRTALDPYALVGLTLSYDVSRGITLYARGDNLLDKLYLDGFDRRGMPRIWTVGLRASS